MKMARIGITCVFSLCSKKWIAEAEPLRENKKKHSPVNKYLTNVVLFCTLVSETAALTERLKKRCGANLLSFPGIPFYFFHVRGEQGNFGISGCNFHSA
jgi:hypothetical protein